MIIFLIIAVFLIFLLEGIPIIKRKLWKELITVGFILSIAVLLQISKELGMITPINLIETIFKPIGKMFFYNL